MAHGLGAGAVLVTGAAGFIGSHLCEALVAAGRRVVAIDRRPVGTQGVEAHRADLVDAPLPALLDGVRTVFHLAAQPGVRASWNDFGAYLHANVAASQALLAACTTQRVVLASSSSVYGNAAALPVAETAALRPVSPYGATKVAAEAVAGAYARSFGLDVVTLRYFTVYGPRQRPDMAIARFIAALDAGEPMKLFGDGAQLRDFTYVGDVVAATLAAEARGAPGGVYNVASGDPRPLREVVELLAEVCGRPAALELLPEQAGDARDTWAAIAAARDALGWAPATALREGLAAQVAAARPARAA